MATGARRSRNGLRDPQEMTRAPLQTNSDAHRNLRYSYTPTPTEFQRPVFEQFSPADSTIDESPISPQEGGRTNFAERAMNAHFPPAHASVPPTSGPNTPAHPHGIHPAHFAPYAEPAHQPEAPGHLQEPQSPGPLPIKVDRVPTSPKAATIHNSPHEERKLGFPGLAPATDHRPLVYNPDSLVGPNVAHETHRPGQVLHPNGTVEPEWKHGLCEVDTLCCTGIFCPCMVYGKTQYRLSRKQQKQEPTDLLGYESCNLSCGIMAAACGFQCERPYNNRNHFSLANYRRGSCCVSTKPNSKAV